MRRAFVLFLALAVFAGGAWSDRAADSSADRESAETGSEDVAGGTAADDTAASSLADGQGAVSGRTAPVLAFVAPEESGPRPSSVEPATPPVVRVERDDGLAMRFHRVEEERGDPTARRPIRSAPDDNAPVVDRRYPGDVVMLGGAIAHDQSGRRWLNVVDERWAEIGWMRHNAIGGRSGIVARNGDGTAAATSHPGGWTTGVEILPPVIVAVGCDAVQVEITSATHHAEFSSHLRYGTTEPHAPRASWEDPTWDMGSSAGVAYIRPRGRIRVTLPAAEATTYYFLAYNQENRAPTGFDFNGNAILNEEGELTAGGTKAITVTGVCSAENR